MFGTNAALATLEEILATLQQSVVETSSSHRMPGDISVDAPLQKGGLELDSVAVVELIAAVEGRLRFQFLDSDLNARSFASLRTLAQVIRTRLEKSGSKP